MFGFDPSPIVGVAHGTYSMHDNTFRATRLKSAESHVYVNADTYRRLCSVLDGCEPRLAPNRVLWHDPHGSIAGMLLCIINIDDTFQEDPR